MRPGRSLPLVFWALTIAVGVFAAWCVWAIGSTRFVRSDIEANVEALGALQEMRMRLDRLTTEPFEDLTVGEWRGMDDELARVTRATQRRGAPAELGASAHDLEAALRRAKSAPERDVLAQRQALFEGIDRLTVGLRRHSRELSVVIAGRLDNLNAITGAAFVFAAATLVLLAVAHRRRLRAEESERAIAHHHELLRAAASRWAGGDLSTALAPSGEAHDSVERALDDVRRSLVAKLAEIESLNEALYHQIRERSQQLADALARLEGDGGTSAPRTAGTVFAGRYEIVEPLGEGGMGVVFRVKRLTDQRCFALKILHRIDNDLVKTRFFREASLLTEIRHPNVVAIHDVGASPSGELYLVTELIEGKNLAEDTQWRGPEKALVVLAAIASGLAEVHARGIVHRDLKPANVVVARGAEGGAPIVKLIDFGVARAVEPGEAPHASLSLPVFRESAPPDETAGKSPSNPDKTVASGRSPTLTPARSIATTQHGVIMGTPRYIAPEVVLEGGRVTVAADVFAFGVTAYWLLTGEMPFRESPAKLMLRRSSLPVPAALSVRCPSMPVRVADLLMRCLSEAPEVRPSAEELARELAS